MFVYIFISNCNVCVKTRFLTDLPFNDLWLSQFFSLRCSFVDIGNFFFVAIYMIRMIQFMSVENIITNAFFQSGVPTQRYAMYTKKWYTNYIRPGCRSPDRGEEGEIMSDLLRLSPLVGKMNRYYLFLIHIMDAYIKILGEGGFSPAPSPLDSCLDYTHPKKLKVML